MIRVRQLDLFKILDDDNDSDGTSNLTIFPVISSRYVLI